ncbi:hypothetical protein Pfo_029606 [Paulownia fortunei]|nr:hypothetical protein Pfo_029606 [Paulownia fortunei]
MIFARQNIRGLNALEKQAAIRKLVHEHNIPMFCVIETHVNKVNQSHILRNIFANWRCIDNYSWNVLGRIWVCWNPMLIDSHMNELDNCINLDDLKAIGLHFTWNSGGDGSIRKFRKLDRVLVNSCWKDYFPLSQAEYLPFGISDHTPIFFDFWLQHKHFLDLVADIWSSDIKGVPMFRVCKKFKLIKIALKKLNKHEFSDISKRVNEAKSKLESIQRLIDENPLDNTLHHKERVLLKDFHELSNAEESFMKQKSRIQWLNLRDQNTSFFHKQFKQRNNTNRIMKVVLEDNSVVAEYDKMKLEIVEYFKNLLGEDPDLMHVSTN